MTWRCPCGGNFQLKVDIRLQHKVADIAPNCLKLATLLTPSIKQKVVMLSILGKSLH
jgi:hypothetical protein